LKYSFQFCCQCSSWGSNPDSDCWCQTRIFASSHSWWFRIWDSG